MNKQFIDITVFVLMFLSVAAFAEDEDAPGDFSFSGHGILITGRDGEKHGMDSLTPEERVNFIRHLRDMMNSSNDISKQRAIYALFILKDDEAVKKIAAIYHGEEAGNTLESFSEMLEAGDGAIIHYLIPDVYDDHGKMVGPSKMGPRGQMYEGDIPASPVKLDSAALILKCIMDSGEFPAEAKSWAHDLTMDLSGASDPVANAVYDQLKEWWEHNKDAVNTKQYGKATWLPKEKIDAKKLNDSAARSN